MNQEWFEMRALRRRRLDSAVWIPLRASQVIEEEGKYGYVGYKEEFFGAGTIAVPLEKRDKAEELGWTGLGISYDPAPYADEDKYVPADVFELSDYEALNLVLEQRGNSIENRIWYLHHDLEIGLRLKRENDEWVGIDEGYKTIARLSRNEEGAPSLLEIRARHLKDFLVAREMALYITSYRSRRVILPNTNVVDWKDTPIREDKDGIKWEGRIRPIHEGGLSYGAKTAVFHASRTDVDKDDDIPLMPPPTEGSEEVSSRTVEHSGDKLFYTEGELWKTEWVEPGTYSPRFRGDERPSPVQFIIDAEGTLASGDELVEGGRWLWFRPEVITELAHRRGGGLSWYTKDTGRVACSPQYGVHFGMNTLALVNVYAKDIATLPEWQQRIWAGYNTDPEGGVSGELLSSQVEANPADTQAPEEFLTRGLTVLNQLSDHKLGFSLLRSHHKVPEILERTHRFRSTDRAGLFALAKDIARLTADSIDAAGIHDYLSLPKGDKPGSLKATEKLLAQQIESGRARRVMGPLVGAYELRHGDAHLPSSDIDESMELAKVDKSQPPVIQGFQLLHSCVSSVWTIIDVLREWEQEPKEVDNSTSDAV
jgi:hypothetical protein